MKTKRNSRRSTKVRRASQRRVPRKHSPRPRTGGLIRLDHAVGNLLAWSARSEGLTASIRSASRGVEAECRQTNAASFIATLQAERPVIEELYNWMCGTKSGSDITDSAGLRQSLDEGAAIVNAMFDRMMSIFGIGIIHQPDEIIPTPDKRLKRYKFSTRFNPDLRTSRVLYPGLQQGRKLIAPCEVEQIPTEERTSEDDGTHQAQLPQ
jgi:hypothetical protein